MQQRTTQKEQLLAQRLKVLGDPCRMRIFCMLFAKRAVCVSEIADEMGVSVAVVSHHVRALARAGYVLPQRAGKQVCYVLTSDAFVDDVRSLLCKYRS